MLSLLIGEEEPDLLQEKKDLLMSTGSLVKILVLINMKNLQISDCTEMLSITKICQPLIDLS
jgi:hypothetical protein